MYGLNDAHHPSRATYFLIFMSEIWRGSPFSYNSD